VDDHNVFSAGGGFLRRHMGTATLCFRVGRFGKVLRLDGQVTETSTHMWQQSGLSNDTLYSEIRNYTAKLNSETLLVTIIGVYRH